MAEYVAGRGTTALGIIGTVLGGLGTSGINLLGNGAPASGMYVDRYTMEQEKTIAQKDSEIAYWRGQDKTNEKISAAYANLESQINALASEVRCNRNAQCEVNTQQAVYNGTNAATIACIQGQVATLMGLTKTVVPNSSVCPGWGNVTVTPAAATTT
jgi:hypothetical protein